MSDHTVKCYIIRELLQLYFVFLQKKCSALQYAGLPV